MSVFTSVENCGKHSSNNFTQVNKKNKKFPSLFFWSINVFLLLTLGMQETYICICAFVVIVVIVLLANALQCKFVVMVL